MIKSYTLIGGAILSITVVANTYEGYRISAELDCGPVDGENHTHGKNGGTLIDNLDLAHFAPSQTLWWDKTYYAARSCRTAAIANRVAERMIMRASDAVGEAIEKREAKLRMMRHILP